MNRKDLQHASLEKQHFQRLSFKAKNVSKPFQQLNSRHSQHSLNNLPNTNLNHLDNFSDDLKSPRLHDDVETLRITNRSSPGGFTRSIGTIISSINKSFSTVFSNLITQDPQQQEQLIESSKSRGILPFYKGHSPPILMSPGKVPSDSFLPRLQSQSFISVQKNDTSTPRSLLLIPSPSINFLPTTSTSTEPSKKEEFRKYQDTNESEFHQKSDLNQTSKEINYFSKSFEKLPKSDSIKQRKRKDKGENKNVYC